MFEVTDQPLETPVSSSFLKVMAPGRRSVSHCHNVLSVVLGDRRMTKNEKDIRNFPERL